MKQLHETSYMYLHARVSMYMQMHMSSFKKHIVDIYASYLLESKH